MLFEQDDKTIGIVLQNIIPMYQIQHFLISPKTDYYRTLILQLIKIQEEMKKTGKFFPEKENIHEQ